MGESGTSTHVPANFDPVARLYRWAEYLLMGPLLTRTRRHFLPLAAGAHRVWAFGEGDGRFLAALLQRSPALTAVAVDASPAMLHLLAQRCAAAGERLHTTLADVAHLALDTLGEPADLAVTHFFLDCLPDAELRSLAQRLGRHLAPGACWLVSDFRVPARQPWRVLGATLIRGLYVAFRLLTRLQVQRLPEVAPALEAAGFRRIHHASWCKGLLYSELWRLETVTMELSDTVTRNSPRLPAHPLPCEFEP